MPEFNDLHQNKPAFARFTNSLVFNNSVTATEALNALGEYNVEKRPIVALPSDKTWKMQLAEVEKMNHYHVMQWVRSLVPSDYFHMVRDKDVLGKPVTKHYFAIQPHQLAKAWDETVFNLEGDIAPIKTIFSLFGGGVVGFSTALPDIQINDETVQQNLNVTNGLDGKNGINLIICSHCIICANTFAQALRYPSDTKESGYERRTVFRHEDVEHDLRGWMKHLYQTALDNTGVIREAYKILARTKVVGSEIQWIMDSVYPNEKEPQEPDFPDPTEYQIFERSYLAWKNRMGMRQQHQAEWERLFLGGARGAELAVRQGTAWGLFQAFVEKENHTALKKIKADTLAQSVLYGNRAANMSTAYEACMKVAVR